MFKEIFTRLIRHLPSRLVHRDPLPGAQQTVNTVVPPSLSAHCLKMAVMHGLTQVLRKLTSEMVLQRVFCLITELR